MAKDEEMLKELYELLTLYFEISIAGGLVKSFENKHRIEPALDRAILREALHERIIGIIISQQIHSL